MIVPKETTLYYVHDPMCSWCWGFRSTWHHVQEALPQNLGITYLLGGLAEDTQQAMPASMQSKIAGIWKIIQQQIPGTAFSFDFWEQNTPRRSTYPACRAVIAARQQKASCEQEMIAAIQKAYYLQAKNPSDTDVLIQLADKLGLNTRVFEKDLNSAATQRQLLKEIHAARALNIDGFPSLVLLHQQQHLPILIDYNDPEAILRQIRVHCNYSTSFTKSFR